MPSHKQNPLFDKTLLDEAPVPRRTTFQVHPDVDAQIPTVLPLHKPSNPVKQNRLEFIAELFIIILTTRADLLSLVLKAGPSFSTSESKPEELLYEFKHTLAPISTLNSGEDLFSCMYKPQAARTTSCSLSGRYSRFWRMAITSLLLRDEIPELFNSSNRTFDFFYDNLHELASYGIRGFQMTAIGSKRALFDIVSSYTIVGQDTGISKSKIDYLEGMGEYEKRLFIYMSQVCAYFLIPERPDPNEVFRTGTHPTFQGLIETPIMDNMSLSSTGVSVVNAADELKEVKYFLKSVDRGVIRPNLSELKKQINQLPKPLPLR